MGGLSSVLDKPEPSPTPGDYSASTSGDFSRYQVDPSRGKHWNDGEMDTEGLQGELSRQQVQLFDSHFQPFEEEMFGLVDDDGYANRMAQRAHGLTKARATSGPSTGQAQRQAQRYGAQMTPRDAHRGSRQRGLTAALGSASAANEARQRAEQHQMTLAWDMNSIGQKLSERASQNVGDAAEMARERERQRQQMEAKADGQSDGIFGLGVGPL